MFQDLDIVKLKRDLVDIKDSTDEIVTIPAGTYGTVLIVYCAELGFPATDPLHCEVEFLDGEGHTLGLLPVSEADLEFDSSYEQRKAAASARDKLLKLKHEKMNLSDEKVIHNAMYNYAPLLKNA